MDKQGSNSASCFYRKEDDFVNGLPNLFQGMSFDTKVKDSVAKLLKTSPAVLAEFERTYAKQALEEPGESIFDINSRQASAKNRLIDADTMKETADTANVTELENRIVEELLAQTIVWKFDGALQTTSRELVALPATSVPVAKEDICTLPQSLRPQLTGTLMTKDISADTFIVLLSNYERYLHGKDKRTRMLAYNLFRQGLDILDLDGITYNIIDTLPLPHTITRPFFFYY